GGQTHTGAAKTSLTNEDITWETTTATNIGVDASFLSSRLTISADLYQRRTEDILLDLPIPGIVGRGAPTQNAGVVENNGWELSVNWRERAANEGDFSYSIDFNLSDNRNEVVDLVGTGPYISWMWATIEGQPIGVLYGYEAVGLFQSQQEIDNHAFQHPQTHPGDVKWKDQNEDGIINQDDKVPMGSELPRYQFGLNMSASYGNFDASVFFQGVGKQDRYVILGLAEGPIWENYTTEWHLDYWTPDNPDARVPAPYLYQNQSTANPNSWWVLDAKYVKLRNLQVGYTLPETATNWLGVQRMRVYLSGKNLWQYTPMELGLDPEYPGPVGDYYPQTKSISLGTNISF
ncbi:MAG: TonB-dependent receptor, partial [Longimicrobiales bacterium]|nr:TonB-dependent receptor [Longimicrobiales bacterium]